MIPLQAVALLLVAAGALAVVLVHDLVRLAIVVTLYGLLLVVLFLVFQAPDVALSELVAGSVAFPFILLATLAKLHGRREDK